MDLEKLTKHQTILLALLLSFVTSIATGIVTVTLMDQAPPAMTNTINRIVERTVEVVVPDPKGQAASVITKETTVVVKEEDLITDAIKKGSEFVVRIETQGEEEGYNTILLGSVISKNGMIITDSEYVTDDGEYFARIKGQRYPLVVLGQNEEKNLAILSVSFGEGEEKKEFQAASFADMQKLELGQTLISLGGVARDIISTGVISGLVTKNVAVEPTDKEDDENTEPRFITQLSRIDTNISGTSISGGPNINVFGDMIGMTVKSKNGTFVVPASSIVAFVQELEAKKTEKVE